MPTAAFALAVEPGGIAEATPTPPPELAAALPKELHLAVPDPLGEWTLDVLRHDHGVDLVFSGHAALGAVVHDAAPELRDLLFSHGHSTGAIEFRDAGNGHPDASGTGAGTGGGPAHPHGQGPRTGPGSSVTRKAPAHAPTAAEPRLADQTRLNRLA